MLWTVGWPGVWNICERLEMHKKIYSDNLTRKTLKDLKHKWDSNIEAGFEEKNGLYFLSQNRDQWHGI
jgi:hypothetical protein